VIDDFQVPTTRDTLRLLRQWDSLTLGTIAGVVDRHRLRLFYPRLPSQEETGRRTGAIVLAPMRRSSAAAERANAP